MLRVDVKVEGDLKAILRETQLQGEIAVTRAVHGAARSLHQAMRQQVRSAGLGGRLANTIRERLYPAAEPSMKAAGLVWTKAPRIIDAHERGALIRSKSGFWLAIPLPTVRMKGARGGKITPGEYERRTGRRLRFVYRRGRAGLLVDDGTLRAGNAPAFGARKARGFRNRTIPVFVLVPQVKLRKRLDFGPLAARAIARVPGAIVANWRDV